MKTKVYGASHAKALSVKFGGETFNVNHLLFDVHEFCHYSNSKVKFDEYFKANPAADWEAVGERAVRLVKIMMTTEKITEQFAPDVKIDPEMPKAIHCFILDMLGVGEGGEE